MRRFSLAAIAALLLVATFIPARANGIDPFAFGMMMGRMMAPRPYYYPPPRYYAPQPMFYAPAPVIVPHTVPICQLPDGSSFIGYCDGRPYGQNAAPANRGPMYSATINGIPLDGRPHNYYGR